MEFRRKSVASKRPPVQLRAAAWQAVVKLAPRHMLRNPVMFVVWVGAALTTLLGGAALLGGPADAAPAFVWHIAAWLWFTAYFGNLAEAVAEGRGKAQASALRATRTTVPAKVLAEPSREAKQTILDSSRLHTGDLVLVEAGDILPSDGEILHGCATIDESAITGESAPVVRESGGDRSAVTGGTRLLSDWLVVRVTAEPGHTFLDRMIALVEGAQRGKTPNEVALDVLLAGLTLILLAAVAALLPASLYSVAATRQGAPVALTVLVALLVCLIPTTIGGLLSAIGVAGMDRMLQANVLATSGRAVEAAGDVDVLLLDKTGTITFGSRQATEGLASPGVRPDELAEVARLASLTDPTPEGQSIVTWAERSCALPPLGRLDGATDVPFTAQTRMSGVDWAGRQIRKGAVDAVEAHIAGLGGHLADDDRAAAERIARSGATPLVVCDGNRVLGVIRLKDVVKPGIRERFAQLRQMGIRTVMVTGDNPLTAAAIAAEAGVDDFIAQATPEVKLARIRELRAQGHVVAMTGDGTNDAPALAQADVAVAMNSGTQAAKEAGNLLDLDSNPTKLVDIVHIGKQLLITRGSLTTFSIANDVAKYFAILPAAFAGTYPQLGLLDVMRLGSPERAVLAATIFNALILVALIPLALRGVHYRPKAAGQLLLENLTIYGIGGVVLPFAGIKLVAMVLGGFGMA